MNPFTEENLEEIVRQLQELEYKDWSKNRLLGEIFGYHFKENRDVQQVLESFDADFLDNLGVIVNKNFLLYRDQEGERFSNYFPEGALKVWQAGIAAYNSGNHQDALNLFRLAEEGYKRREDNINASFVNSWYKSATRKLEAKQQPVVNSQ